MTTAYRALAARLADGVVATPMLHHDNFTLDIPATVKLMADGSAALTSALDEIERLREALRPFDKFGRVKDVAEHPYLLATLMEERISDWFDPSDFLTARASLHRSG